MPLPEQYYRPDGTKKTALERKTERQRAQARVYTLEQQAQSRRPGDPNPYSRAVADLEKSQPSPGSERAKTLERYKANYATYQAKIDAEAEAQKQKALNDQDPDVRAFREAVARHGYNDSDYDTAKLISERNDKTLLSDGWACLGMCVDRELEASRKQTEQAASAKSLADEAYYKAQAERSKLEGEKLQNSQQ